MMTIARIRELLSRINDIKVAVYGDFCLDIYWIMDPRGSETSIETGIPARAVGKQNYYLGGASNIIANLAALGPLEIRAIGAIGDDIFGRELIRKMKKLGVEIEWLVAQKVNFDTFAFCKPYLGGVEDPRIDFGVFNQRHVETEEGILEGLRLAFERSDVIILNQQIPDSISNPSFIDQVNDLILSYPERMVLLDSRQYGDLFAGVFRKANLSEATNWHKTQKNSDQEISSSEIRKFGEALHRNHRKPVFLTMGEDGMMVFDKDGVTAIPGIQLMKRLDPVGAGDAAVSALACSLAAGADPGEAAEFANFAAAVTVQKVFQTGTASPEEILKMAESADYLLQPELADNVGVAQYHDSTNIEICCDPGSLVTGQVTHAVFDHDGTISTIREGWEEIMEDIMLRAILGDQYDTKEAIFKQTREQVRKFIDLSTGIQTIQQMEALAEMVRELGMVPDEHIFDAYGYKRLYNKSLMEKVSPRLNKIKSGEISMTDLTMKGVIPFLKALSRKGVNLYLASGTDQDDVVAEAGALGYAGLFTGGIYGAVDGKVSSKKRVIERIIRENRVQGPELICFGDGPVEMRECRRQNGIAVGVASDEIKGKGLNQKKRERLIKSGAHFIIPDFSDGDALLKLFWGNGGTHQPKPLNS